MIRWEEKEKRVVADREMSIANLVDRFERGHDSMGGIIIPYDNESRDYIARYTKELKNVVAVQRDNRTRYERIGTGDHWMHAIIYAVMAASRRTATGKHAISTQLVRSGRGMGGIPRNPSLRPRPRRF